MLEASRTQAAVAARGLLPPPRFRRMAGFLGRAMALGYRLAGKDRYDDFRLERVRGHAFIILPSVFNPTVPRTGEFLASRIDSNLVHPDMEVLDLGTGCGVGAVIAAGYARRVVAVDINSAAVRCARINALMNRVEDRIDLRQGDLFAPVAGERFDLVLFNPPFLRGTPRDDRERAWRSSDIAERFAAELGAHLSPGGAALVVLSTFGDTERYLEELAGQAFAIKVVAERSFVNERLALFRVRIPEGREGS